MRLVNSFLLRHETDQHDDDVMVIKPGGTNPLQQRERSFIRNGSRPINNGSNGSGNSSTGSTPYHNFNSANKSNQARAQQLNGAPRANKPNMEIYRPPSILIQFNS